MDNKPMKWTIVVVIILLMGGLASIFSFTDRLVLQPEYKSHLRQEDKFQQRVYDELKEIKVILRENNN